MRPLLGQLVCSINANRLIHHATHNKQALLVTLFKREISAYITIEVNVEGEPPIPVLTAFIHIQ